MEQKTQSRLRDRITAATKETEKGKFNPKTLNAVISMARVAETQLVAVDTFAKHIYDHDIISAMISRAPGMMQAYLIAESLTETMEALVKTTDWTHARRYLQDQVNTRTHEVTQGAKLTISGSLITHLAGEVRHKTKIELLNLYRDIMINTEGYWE